MTAPALILRLLADVRTVRADWLSRHLAAAWYQLGEAPGGSR